MFIELTNGATTILLNVDNITDILHVEGETVEISVIDRDPINVDQSYEEVKRLIVPRTTIHSLEHAKELAAQAWCAPTTSNLVMIPELANAFAEILFNSRCSY